MRFPRSLPSCDERRSSVATHLLTFDIFCRILILAGSIGMAASASSHPLEDATESATALCAKVDGEVSLEDCGSMLGMSSERKEARRAVFKVFQARAAFMSQCWASSAPGRCTEQADWYMESGMYRFRNSLKQESATRAPPLPPPDKRR